MASIKLSAPAAFSFDPARLYLLGPDDKCIGATS